MISPYIEKSKECIKDIPKLKNEIQDLSSRIKKGEDDESIIKELQLKTIVLKHYIRALEALGVIGNVLIEVYFNNKDIKLIANKYNICSDTVKRYKYFSEKYNNDWQSLAILLYGIDVLVLDGSR